jgi:hypothetical protein
VVVTKVATGVYCFNPAPGAGFDNFVVATPVDGDSASTTIQTADTSGDTCTNFIDNTLEVETYVSGVLTDEAFEFFLPSISS